MARHRIELTLVDECPIKCAHCHAGSKAHEFENSEIRKLALQKYYRTCIDGVGSANRLLQEQERIMTLLHPL